MDRLDDSGGVADGPVCLLRGYHDHLVIGLRRQPARREARKGRLCFGGEHRLSSIRLEPCGCREDTAGGSIALSDSGTGR